MSICIVTIDPTEDTEKYIADYEAVQSNIKLYRERERERQMKRERDIKRKR